jgi:hypothetical protein
MLGLPEFKRSQLDSLTIILLLLNIGQQDKHKKEIEKLTLE